MNGHEQNFYMVGTPISIVNSKISDVIDKEGVQRFRFEELVNLLYNLDFAPTDYYSV